MRKPLGHERESPARWGCWGGTVEISWCSWPWPCLSGRALEGAILSPAVETISWQHPTLSSARTLVLPAHIKPLVADLGMILPM